MRIKILFISACLIVSVCSCKKPFTPAVISAPNSYLVVEGVLNAGNDSTVLKLSRTSALADTAKINPEPGATVYVEDGTGTNHFLRDAGSGLYKSVVLGIQNAQKCRLHITTSQGKEYISDFVNIDHTPPIDSIPYKVNGNGVQFYAYTHDASNNTRYYRWNFDETYAYISYYRSMIKYENAAIVYRTQQSDDIYHCYNTTYSNNIILASTQDITSSVVNNQPITYVLASSGKLARGYSLLLREYALSKDAYEYWQKLKKNTEQLGSIFDAQPSTLTGNLHAVADSNEPVLGYISASTISSKRIFLDPFNLSLFSPSYSPPPTDAECGKGVIPVNPANSLDARLKVRLSKGDSILVEPVSPPGGPITGYSLAPVGCADCRFKIKTGTNVKPSYWPANLQ